MILTRLNEFWERQGNALPSGYQNSFLTKRIIIDSSGKARVVAMTGETRGKRSGKTFPVPREQPQRTVAVRPRLVHDNPNYALGLCGVEDKPEKVAIRHEAYIVQLERCLAETKEPAIASLLRWMRSDGPTQSAITEQIDPDLDELYFEVDGLDPASLPSVRTFWNGSDEGVIGTCLVTGAKTVVVERMPFPIKGIPGGQTSGTMLVSVNNASGESFGLDAAFNSPIGKAAAEGVCNALNYLLASPKHRLMVGETVYVFWCRTETDFDPWEFLNQPDPEHVAHLIDSTSKGGKASDVDEADFFVLSLSANASRIVVRDYQETTLTSVKASLKSWFDRLAIIGLDGRPARPSGVRTLSESLYREAKNVPKHVPVELIQCALRSGASPRPIPRDLLALAVKRNVTMQGPFEISYKTKRRVLSIARLSLIKAALIVDVDPKKEFDLSALNLNHPSAAYHCGRLLSVLESIQRVAIPNLNTTLVDKNYAVACGSPGVTFGHLITDATKAHLPKLRKNSPGAYRALDKRLIQVVEKIGDEFPRTLNYEDQGLFALGYYHQRASDIAEAIANKELRAVAESGASTDQEND